MNSLTLTGIVIGVIAIALVVIGVRRKPEGSEGVNSLTITGIALEIIAALLIYFGISGSYR